MELHPQEINLIMAIRSKYQFGEIIIECYGGLPNRVGKTTVYEKLNSTVSYPHIPIPKNE